MNSQRGYSLYLRPTMIGTQRTLGVGPPASALLYVIASPVGPYYPTGFKAVSLEATDYAVRAWPGGVGDKKLGANYAPCIVPQMQAASRGFHQNLWLFGEEEYVTEVGTMNLFAAIKNKETGQPELLTAPLDGTILEGVTRDSVLSLARERLEPKGWKVLERKFTMKELADAADEGRMMEVFGSGTAAIVSPVRRISWRGRLVECGLPEHEECGPITQQIKDWIEGIQYGDEDHPWRYVVQLCCHYCRTDSEQLQGPRVKDRREAVGQRDEANTESKSLQSSEPACRGKHAVGRDGAQHERSQARRGCAGRRWQWAGEVGWIGTWRAHGSRQPSPRRARSRRVRRCLPYAVVANWTSSGNSRLPGRGDGCMRGRPA